MKGCKDIFISRGDQRGAFVGLQELILYVTFDSLKRSPKMWNQMQGFGRHRDFHFFHSLYILSPYDLTSSLLNQFNNVK